MDTSSSGMEADIEYLTKEASKFDLHLMLRERSDGGLHGDLIYSCDLFEDQTMDKFSEHFINVVKAVSTGAMGKVSIHALPMLDQEETHMLQDVWNQSAPAVEFPPTIGIANTIIESAVRHQDNVAVEICGGNKYTYRELLDRTKRVATGILNLAKNTGQGTQLRIATMLDNDIDM